jgi:hypothetical protein
MRPDLGGGFSHCAVYGLPKSMRPRDVEMFVRGMIGDDASTLKKGCTWPSCILRSGADPRSTLQPHSDAIIRLVRHGAH